MSKTRIFLQPELIKETITIKDTQILHKLKDVLRLSPDDPFYIFDGQGREYLYKIIKISKKELVVSKQKETRYKPEPLRKLVLAFAILNEENMEFILQKGTELGVDKFIPFISQHSIPWQITPNKLKRWQTIIIEAARQSERLWLPAISDTVEFKELLIYDFPIKLAAVICGQDLASELSKKEGDILIVIGPKGDFSTLELKLLNDAKFKAIKLSENILKAETAAIFAVGLLRYLLL